MIHNKKKLAKITEELTMFCFGIGATELSSCIKYSADQGVITFKSNYDPKMRHKLESVHKLLNSEHDDGVEDVYWELVGSGDPGEPSQLLLIGMMIERADVEISDTQVVITMYKKLD